jgi:hypothetical protein
MIAWVTGERKDGADARPFAGRAIYFRVVHPTPRQAGFFSRQFIATMKRNWRNRRNTGLGPVATMASLVLGTLLLVTEYKATAGKYGDLASQGYRWVIVDGPYACPKREDAIAAAEHPQTALDPNNPTKSYYLVKGSIIQLLQTDGAVSRIRLAGITSDLWTMTRFLSKQPLKNAYGITETPETAGLSVEATPAPSGSPGAPGISPAPTPIDQFNPGVTPSESPSPSTTPLQN